MQSGGDDSVRKQMEGLRIACGREIGIHQQRLDDILPSFRDSLELAKSKAHGAVQNQARVVKLKAQLREEEDNLVKALAEKTRKEAKRMATEDSIAATKVRIEELKRTVDDLRTKKDGYAAIIAQQTDALGACKEKLDKDAEYRQQVKEAVSWYNKVLGFQIECGHGVKFMFTNMDSRSANQKYSFTIRHENDTYTMLDCDPHLDGTKELLNELNKTNGLFRFVRTMRKKFQEASGCGKLPSTTLNSQESVMISISAPVSSVSTDYSETPSDRREHQSGGEANKNGGQTKNLNHGRRRKSAVLSPLYASSSMRSSPRLRAKK